MSVSEFEKATVGQTIMFIEERQKRDGDEWKTKLNEYRLNRLNTWIIARTFGLKQSSPGDLYNLPDEESKSKTDPFSKEVDAIFEKMEKVKFDKVAKGDHLINQFK